MKTVTVEEASNHLDELVELVSRGEHVELTLQAKPVARLVPVERRAEEETVDWSGARSRLKKLWGGNPAPGKPASQIIIDDRR